MTPRRHQQDAYLKFQEMQQLATNLRGQHQNRHQSRCTTNKPFNFFHQGGNQRALPPYRGGGVALLMARLDPDTIRLVVRWLRETILRYLHMTAKSFTEGLFVKMFEHGTYALIPPTNASN